HVEIHQCVDLLATVRWPFVAADRLLTHSEAPGLVQSAEEYAWSSPSKCGGLKPAAGQSLTPLVFPITGRPAKSVGRTPGPRPAPWPACPLWMRLILLAKSGVQGDPRGPGGPPHNFCGILRTGKTSGVRLKPHKPGK